MSLVYLDTMMFSYTFDVRSPFHADATTIVKRSFRPPNAVVSSLFLEGELLVIPKRRRDEFSTARVHHLLASVHVTMSLTRAALPTFIELRADFGIKPPDALHLALASLGGTDFFVTNDHKLLTLTVPGIGKIVGLDEALQVL